MDSTTSGVKPTTRVVVAIDFGTSRSGYAYAFVDDKDIKYNIDWPGSPVKSAKTLTELLYSPEKRVLGSGFMARRMLAGMRRDEARGHSLLKTFKMDIHAGLRSGGAPAVRKLPNGVEFSIDEVIVDYLRIMKDMALQRVKTATGGELRDNEVLWCLTVPAIWSDREKNVMRQAAHRAGLIEELASERLLLALEPEAAAIYCQETARFQLKPGQRFMIVDCGGGTVDITAHETSGENRLVELAEGTGGAYGSTYVDQSFRRYLGQRLGSPLVDEFERECPAFFLDLMENWERIKCDFGPTADEKVEELRTGWVGRIRLDASLYKLLEAKAPQVLQQLEEDQGDDSYLELDYGTVEGIFAPVLQQIVLKVREELKRLTANNKKCDYLLLVGGFAESPLLQHVIRQEFEGTVGSVVVPSFPGAAVVQGAVGFGLDPKRIRSRRSRLTYGWATHSPYDSIAHAGRKSEMQNGKQYCPDVYDVIVRAGTAIDTDQVVTKKAYPLLPDQKAIQFRFYASKLSDVKYTDEPGVTQVGTMTIEMPDISGGKDRPVEVRAKFGGTEIQVEATDLTSGKKARTTLRFSSTFSAELLGD